MRNVEDLILQTLRVVIADGTDIPSGRIYLKKPAKEFVSKDNGPNLPSGAVTEFPAIGINYMSPAKFAPNNYGNSIVIDNGDDTSTEYSPMAEITLYLGISLFTVSRKDQRDYGSKLYMTLLENRLISLLNDVLDSEYFRIDLISQKDVDGTMPYQQVFIAKAQSRILRETTANTVYTLETNLGAEELRDVADIQVTSLFTASSGSTTWG